MARTPKVSPEDRVLNAFGNLQRKQFSTIPGDYDENYRAALVLSQEGYITFSLNDEQHRPILIEITDAGRLLVKEGGYSNKRKKEKKRNIFKALFKGLKGVLSLLKP